MEGPRKPEVPRILLIDNYDSYTFNLYQLIAAVNGGTPSPTAHHTYRHPGTPL